MDKAYIEREAAIRMIKEDLPEVVYYCKEDAIECLECLSTADVVEVVRCKDCEWWTKQEDSAQGRCGLMGIYPTGYWYCGNGRRTNND